MQEAIEKEIQTSLESVKAEILVSEMQLESKQGVRRIIKKYQGRVADMLKLIQKQKRHNDTLKEEFKQLNEQLNSVLKKMQQRPKEQEQKGIDSRLEIMKKELENEIKKNGILRKEVEQLRYKCKYLDSEKIDSFKNQIKEKEHAIEQLNAQIKLFQKLDKQEKNGDSYKKEEELTQKILQQNQQIIHLKKKIQEAKKKEQQLQKSAKNLRLEITQLEGKVNGFKGLEEKQKGKAQNLLQDQMEKLKDKYKQLQNAKKMNDRSSRQQIDTLAQKVKSLERELTEIKDTVNRKDKESSILLFKLKEKQRKNYNTLQPIKSTRYSQQILHSSGNLFEVRKQSKGLSWGQGIFREFEDSLKLPAQKNYRIKRISFNYAQEHILSLTAVYEIIEGDIAKNSKKEIKSIESFAIPAQYPNIKAADYNFADYEYIKSMEVFSGKGIQYIKITTSKQEVLEIGNPKSIPKCKQQSFQIGTHEKPISFLGVVQNRKLGGQNREFLASIGLQLKRKEVFLRGRGRKLQSSLNRSVVQTTRGKAHDLKQS